MPSDGTVIRKHRSGFTVIEPEEQNDFVPLTCPVCEMLMRSYDDPSSYRKYKCCADCALRWAEPDRERWSSGWRPSDVDVKERVKIRLSLPIKITV